MMKTFLIILNFMIAGVIFAQVGDVGINTNSPAVTLDVIGHPTDGNKFDGIIAPRMTGEQMRAKTYGNDQNGALVYATVADTAPAGQTVNVTARGYYYFDADLGTTGQWVALIGGGGYHKLRLTTNNPIVIQPDDYTIGYTARQNVSTTLPSASNHPQRIIRLCALDGYGGSITIYGVASTQFPGGQSAVSSASNGAQACYQLQSDGNNWYVIGSFR